MIKIHKLCCVLISILLITGIAGCKSKKDFVLSNNDEYFSLDDDEATTDADTETSETKSTKQNTGNNKNDKSGNNTSSDIDLSALQGSDNFSPIEVPSRKNAYKLTNVYNKMKKGEKINVVFFGGSVTGGTKASSEAKSWRGLTTKYLKSTSSGIVTSVNAALGGTGSYLGAARFENDVLSKNPDLLFIEFTINDYYSDISTNRIKANLEYMINKLYDQNANADIVFVLLANDNYFGTKYPSYTAHKEVADYYKIPIVDFNCELYNQLKGSTAAFKKLLADSVHPNDSGYQQYANIMIKALKELLVAGTTTPHKVPAKKLCSNGFSTLNNVLAGSISASGWDCKSWWNNTEYEKSNSQFRTSGLKLLYPNYLAPKETSSTITYNFTGNSFGMLGTIKEGVTIEFVLDSGTKKTINGVSKDELLEYPVFENLSNTSHTVTVTVYGTPPNAAIAAFVTTKP